MRNQNLKSILKRLEYFKYRKDYTRIFDDLLNIVIHFLNMNPDKKLELVGYTDEEKKELEQMFKELILSYNEEITDDGMWYDPLGELYEEINSKYKASGLGQFFTPATVVNFMVEMNIDDSLEGKTVIDPAAGSGRMLICSHAKNPKNIHYAVDVDQICFKMCAVNMCIHGCVGEVLHGNTITQEYYKAYKVNPGFRFRGLPGLMEVDVEDTYVYPRKVTVQEKALEVNNQIASSNIQQLNLFNI